MSASVHSGTQLSTRVLQDTSEIAQIRSEWRGLFHRARGTAFQHPDWLLPWIEVFSPEKLIFVELRSADRLVGIAPLLIYRRDSDRVLAFAGGGVSDYLDVLVDPEFEPQAISAILESVLDLGENWNILDFTDLPGHSPLLNKPLLKLESKEHDTCSVLHLPDNPDELLHVFSKRQRANLRNARSRLERAGGGFLETATGENVCEFLNDLFTLHTDRWSGLGESGVLAEDRVRRFHSTAAPRLLQEGMLHLSRLRVNNRTRAVIFSLLSGDTTFCYLQGFDPEFSQLSPGTQLMFSAIKNAVSRGMRNFDFLRGDESYKQHWRAEKKPTYRIEIARTAIATLLEPSTERTAA